MKMPNLLKPRKILNKTLINESCPKPVNESQEYELQKDKAFYFANT